MPRITITIEDNSSQPYRFSLDRKLVTIGRGSENDIAVDCRSVSVNHAVMKRVPGGFKLRDMDSTNGTRLDGKKVTEIFLENGQEVKVGDVDFDFQLSDEELEKLAQEVPEESEVENVIEDDAVESDEIEATEDDELPKPKRKRKEKVVRDDDGDEVEKDEKPRRKARSNKPVQQKKTAQPPSAAKQTLVTIGWIVGAAFAFYLGMSIRYQNDTGRSLTPDLNHPPAQQADDDGDDTKRKE